jgi:hypothetical protein
LAPAVLLGRPVDQFDVHGPTVGRQCFTSVSRP